ncbi:MAG: ATP-binding protein [Gaiellaceae bacterium]
MSTSEQTRTSATPSGASPREAVSPAVTLDGRSSLRADLEAVWAISASEGSGAGVDAVLAFAAIVVQQAAVQADEQPLAVETAGVVSLVAEIAGLSECATRRALFRHASRRLALVGRDPSASLAGQLRLLLMLSPVTAASVWLPAASGGVEAAAASGPLALTRRCKHAAAAVLAGDDEAPQPHRSRVRVHAYPLRRRERREGALVIRMSADAYTETLPFLEEFAFVFASLLERELLLRASSSDERRLGQSYERRLVRTAFDLHDGPLQDLAVLAAEVRLLRSQINGPDTIGRDLLVGRIDDVSGRLVELDHSLRAITQSLETATLAERPLADALRREVDVFSRRASATVRIAASGRLDVLTMSQRIAVVRIVQEALSNVREHSGATHVDVIVRANDDGLTLHVADNGRGFDVRETAAAAARRGRLGIVGMNERVRLLGGVFSIESSDGGGTVVSASIPAWRPLTDAAPGA